MQKKYIKTIKTLIIHGTCDWLMYFIIIIQKVGKDNKEFCFVMIINVIYNILNYELAFKYSVILFFHLIHLSF